MHAIVIPHRCKVALPRPINAFTILRQLRLHPQCKPPASTREWQTCWTCPPVRRDGYCASQEYSLLNICRNLYEPESRFRPAHCVENPVALCCAYRSWQERRYSGSHGDGIQTAMETAPQATLSDSVNESNDTAHYQQNEFKIDR